MRGREREKDILGLFYMLFSLLKRGAGKSRGDVAAEKMREEI